MNIVDWTSQNKQWLFDGIGILLGSLIVRLIISYRKRRKLRIEAKIIDGYSFGIGNSRGTYTHINKNSLEIEISYISGEQPITIEEVGITWDNHGDESTELQDKVTLSPSKVNHSFKFDPDRVQGDRVRFLWAKDLKGKKYFSIEWPDVEEWINSKEIDESEKYRDDNNLNWLL
jgi:hypothetical protein